MATTAALTKLSSFSIYSGSAYVRIPQVVTLTLPDITREKLVTTVLESSGSEYYMGGTENGDASFTVIYDPANTVHQYLVQETNAVVSQQHAFKFALNSSTGSISFSGSLASFKSDSITNKGLMQGTFTITPSNGINFVF